MVAITSGLFDKGNSCDEVSRCHTVEHDPFIEVNVHHAITFWDVMKGKWLKSHADFRGTETCVAHRAVSSNALLPKR